jgi:hypothetical protein
VRLTKNYFALAKAKTAIFDTLKSQRQLRARERERERESDKERER